MTLRNWDGLEQILDAKNEAIDSRSDEYRSRYAHEVEADVELPDFEVARQNSLFPHLKMDARAQAQKLRTAFEPAFRRLIFRYGSPMTITEKKTRN